MRGAPEPTVQLHWMSLSVLNCTQLQVSCAWTSLIDCFCAVLQRGGADICIKEPLMFFSCWPKKTQQCYPLCFFSWRPIKNSVTPYVFIMTTNKKRQFFIGRLLLVVFYYPLCFFSWRPIKNNCFLLVVMKNNCFLWSFFFFFFFFMVLMLFSHDDWWKTTV